jgi:hypothetical protein
MVSNRRLVDAAGPDFYPTPEWGTRALLRHVDFIGPILEPCCGDGAMAEVLKETGQPVVSSDIVDRGYGDTRDFLDIREAQANIVTNPPFNVAETLLAHALVLAEQKVCFLLRTAFLESRRRYSAFYKARPPSKLLIFTERLSMYPKGHDVNGGGTTSYAWFIWDNLDTSSVTAIEWIEPGMKPSRRAALTRSKSGDA